MRSYIPRDLRGSNDGSVFVPQRRNGKRDIDQLSIFTSSNCLVVLDRASCPDAAQNHWLFVQAIRRNQDRDRVSDYFVSRITKNSFGSFVPAANNTIEIFTDAVSYTHLRAHE